jgi:hypothetical protein
MQATAAACPRPVRPDPSAQMGGVRGAISWGIDPTGPVENLPHCRAVSTRQSLLGLLVLYGCVGAAAPFGCFAAMQRVLGDAADAYVARAVGALALLGFAVMLSIGAIQDRDPLSVASGSAVATSARESRSAYLRSTRAVSSHLTVSCVIRVVRRACRRDDQRGFWTVLPAPTEAHADSNWISGSRASRRTGALRGARHGQHASALFAIGASRSRWQWVWSETARSVTRVFARLSDDAGDAITCVSSRVEQLGPVCIDRGQPPDEDARRLAARDRSWPAAHLTRVVASPTRRSPRRS